MNLIEGKQNFPQNTELGIKYLEKSQYEYGKMLYNGCGCDENKQEAIKYFSMSKKNGIKKVTNS